MAKQIIFDYEGKTFTLEYTRRTVELMEGQGFVLNKVDDIPITVIPALFAGSFLAHHRYLKRDKIDEIYSRMPDKPELVKTLAEMYMEPISALMDEPEESDEGNVSWRAT